MPADKYEFRQRVIESKRTGSTWVFITTTDEHALTLWAREVWRQAAAGWVGRHAGPGAMLSGHFSVFVNAKAVVARFSYIPASSSSRKTVSLTLARRTGPHAVTVTTVPTHTTENPAT